MICFMEAMTFINGGCLTPQLIQFHLYKMHCFASVSGPVMLDEFVEWLKVSRSKAIS